MESSRRIQHFPRKWLRARGFLASIRIYTWAECWKTIQVICNYQNHSAASLFVVGSNKNVYYAHAFSRGATQHIYTCLLFYHSILYLYIIHFGLIYDSVFVSSTLRVYRCLCVRLNNGGLLMHYYDEAFPHRFGAVYIIR